MLGHGHCRAEVVAFACKDGVPSLVKAFIFFAVTIPKYKAQYQYHCKIESYRHCTCVCMKDWFT